MDVYELVCLLLSPLVFEGWVCDLIVSIMSFIFTSRWIPSVVLLFKQCYFNWTYSTERSVLQDS